MIWLVGTVLAVVVALVWTQRFAYILQYLFFCRFVVLLALLLVALPIVAAGPAEPVLGNLLVLDALGIGIVTWVALLAAWVAMFTADLVLATVPERFKLRFMRRHSTPPNALRVAYDLVRRASPRRTALFALLALPIVLGAVIRSSAAVGVVGTLGGLGAGVAAAFGLRWLALRLEPVVLDFLRPRAERFAESYGAGGPRLLLGYAATPAIAAHHLLATSFLLATLLVYGVGYWVLRPGATLGFEHHVPALALLLLLCILLCETLSGLALFFDLFRVPLLLIVIGSSFVAYRLANSDHYYRVRRVEGAAAAAGERFTPQRTFRAWSALHPPDSVPVMIVVAASGGGIAASRWTAEVLSGLAGDSLFGTRFARSVALVSSVSGGGVGAMYFVDRYTPNGPPPPSVLDSIRQAAGGSSLEAATWGVLYPDFWRAVPVVSLFLDDTLDRGWAIERVWRAALPVHATLESWSRDAAAGWRPAQVFNATATETGGRFLLSSAGPLAADGGPTSATTFHQLYPGWDVDVVTAARLSAAFPFISPIARPDVPRDLQRVAYHLADGGYYDNFGVMSAIDFLRAVLPLYANRDSTVPQQARRVVVLQIRLADPDSAAVAGKEGWLYAAAGPAVTMLHVRSAAQRARNDLELTLLRDAWSARGVAIDTVTFDLKQRAPLSWQLSPEQLAMIEAAWAGPAARAARRRLWELLNR